MPPKLGIIAGGGELPRLLIAACREQQRPFFVIALDGHVDADTVAGDTPHLRTRIGAGGAIIKALRDNGVVEIVMAGRVRRPSLLSLMPDAWTAKFLLSLGRRALGDNALLSAIGEAIEREGGRLIGPEQILPGLLAPAGVIGRRAPGEADWSDINRGLAVAEALGAVDVGQAVVVQQGIVLGVEAVEGTDALLRRCKELRRDGPGGVLVKTAKPGQERRIDLPTIGPRTVGGAAKAGLVGIAVEAGGALIVDRAAVGAAADEAGLFVVGVAKGQAARPS
ncbi:MAG: UDP-2,3-diacylglucosamine diphosphatase LpxI [Alphaproteobacteria bacterium]|nr:UDP-2,3-diacylglucosamine diphosphatase LpxI [Alphaproteobacteria bacterium]